MMAEQPKAQGRAALHEEMLSRIAILESVMAELGHALPPITKQDLLNIKKAIATLKAQPVGHISITYRLSQSLPRQIDIGAPRIEVRRE